MGTEIRPPETTTSYTGGEVDAEQIHSGEANNPKVKIQQGQVSDGGDAVSNIHLPINNTPGYGPQAGENIKTGKQFALPGAISTPNEIVGDTESTSSSRGAQKELKRLLDAA